MKRRFGFCLIISIIAFTPLLSFSQQSDAGIVNYTTDNGLPQNSVKDINFDKEGYCWLSTEMGLVRFDGKTFKTFGSLEIPGLISERIQWMAKDKDQNLYARTTGGQIISIRNPTGMHAPVPSITNSVNIKIGFGGNAGFAVKNKGLIGEINKMSNSEKASASIWFCHLGKDDLYSYQGNNLYYQSVHTQKRILANSFRNRPGVCTAPIRDDYLLQLSDDNRVKVWKAGKPYDVFPRLIGSSEFRKCHGKRRLLSCDNGTFLYADNKVYRIELTEGKVTAKKILDNIKVPALVSIFYCPIQNKYFLGSETNGLYVVKPSLFLYSATPAEITDQNCYAQGLINDSLIFCRNVLTEVGGFARYLPLLNEMNLALNVSAGRYIYYENGNILYNFDYLSKKVIEIGKLDSKLSSIFSEPQDSSIFFSTRYRIGVIKQNRIISTKTYPPNFEVLNVINLGKKKFLLATESGLKWYDFAENRITRSVLDSASIRAVLPDKNNSLWISTYGKGFYLYEKGKIHRMPNGPKKALRIIHAFIEDKKGNFWLPTNNGLFVVKKSELLMYARGTLKDVYFYRFDKHDGLRTNEFNGGCNPSHLWLKDSLLSLPSLNGLAWFYPNKIRINVPDKKIFIDRIRINYRKISLEDKKIMLHPDFGRLSIAVSSPYFGSQENMRLEYRIKELSSDWLPVSTDDEIIPIFPKHGDYEIVVRRRSDRYLNDQKMLVIPVIIKPWFYDTWWFQLIILAILGLIAHLLIQKRLKTLKLQAQVLEEQVTNRTIELSQAIEELGQSELALLKSNQVKDKVITMVLHDLRSPLRFLSTLCNNLVQTHHTLSQKDLEKKLVDLENSAKSLDHFTERFFSWSLSQHENFIVKKSTFTLNALFSDIEVLYQDIVKINNNRLNFSDSELTCYTDYQILNFILRNLLDNANKNTNNGFIQITAQKNSENIIISITDTGRGLNDKQAEEFLDENRQIGLVGTGSILILKMLHKIDATLTIQSIPGKGSTFSIALKNLPAGETDLQGD